MPKIVKTHALSETNPGGSSYNDKSVLSLIGALADAIGEEYKNIGGLTDGAVIYYVPLSKIGYSSWCIYAGHNTTTGYAFFGVTTFKNNEPNMDDANAIKLLIGLTTFPMNAFEHYETTCVIFRDTSNDGVLINVHPGKTETATDITGPNQDFMILNFFFGRDIEGNDVCGFGHGHINQIRTLNNSMSHGNMQGSGYTRIYQAPVLGDTIHLTKMVNYLSPNYSEMKSIYTAMVRPIANDENEENISYYADDARWASIGPSAPNGRNDSNHGYNMFFPFEPFIKY